MALQDLCNFQDFFVDSLTTHESLGSFGNKRFCNKMTSLPLSNSTNLFSFYVPVAEYLSENPIQFGQISTNQTSQDDIISSLSSPISLTLASSQSVPLPFPMAHGTTTLAFMFQGGVLAAADTRSSCSGLVACPASQKILPIHSHLVGTTSGTSADCALWKRILSRELRLYQLRHGRRLSTSGAAKLLSHMLHPFKGTELCVAATLCGWDGGEVDGCVNINFNGQGETTKNQMADLGMPVDTSLEKTPQAKTKTQSSFSTTPRQHCLTGKPVNVSGPSLCYVCSDGTRLQGSLFSVGSGSPYAYSILDQGVRWGLTLEDATSIAREAVYRATHRDAYSGNCVDVYHVSSKGWTRRRREDLKEEYYREKNRREAGRGRKSMSMAADLLEEEHVTSSDTPKVLPHPQTAENFSVNSKELELYNANKDVKTLPNVAFRLTDRKRNDLDSKKNVARQIDRLKNVQPTAKSLAPKHSPELTVSRKKRSNLFNGEVESVINAHSQVSSSDEHEYALQPELHLETGVGDVLPERTRGRSKWVMESEDDGPRSRRRRSWLWNQFFVIEEYRGPEPVLIGRLHTDMDKGDGRTKYMLEGEGVGSVFVIDSNTGNIHVTKSLDREEKDQYHLTATAMDRQTGRALEPSSQFIIRVQDINDNPPVFPNEPYVAMVPEMANIGTSIVQVTARDADDPTYGNSARLVYAITQGQDYFSVDPQTGVLRTAVPDMDRETRDEYLVVLQAKDMGGHLGGLSGTTTITVKLTDVNDNPPHFRRSSWSFSISELAAPGVEVGRLTATDPDLGENAELEFTILDVEEAETFNLTSRDREAVILLNKLLDYETRSSYTFSVEVTNPIVDPRYLRKGPFKDQATVRVMVLNADEPPQFSQFRYHLDVSENCPPICSVGRVSAVDPDTGQSSNIRYSIDPQSDPEALFRISSDTGLISTVMELDREEEQWHNITVIATQRDNPNLVSRVVVAIETLDQNDNAPELDREYTTSVCDSSAPGQVVQVLRAVDKDQGGQDAPIHFSIPPESSSALNLTIRESGGVTASLVLQSALEPLPGFSSSLLTLYVPVVLRDGASGLTNTGTVTVTICPCLRGGMQTEDRGRQKDRRWERHMVCIPLPSTSTSLIFSLVTLLAMLACVTTLLVVCALSLSLRHQKRDSHSPFEEDDVRENIISYDDEGGGEADTAAFDITALQSMHRIQHIHSNRNIWYTQQNPPRARTYSWSRNPRPGMDPQPRPGSAPLYGRLCYGIHTLPVLRDYPAGPLEAGLQLPQLTHGLSGGHIGNSLVFQNQSTFEPLLRSPEMSSACYEAEHMLAKSKIKDRTEGGEAKTADTKENQDLAKMNTAETSEPAQSDAAAQASRCDPNESSCQSHTSSSSNQQEGRPGSSQTQISTGATSCTLDDIDTDSSIRSLSEQNYSNGGQINSASASAYLPGDTYSIVGSLNPNSSINGTSSSGSYPAGMQLLNMCRLQRKDLTPQSLSFAGGLFGTSRGWACGPEPARAEATTNLQPLRMEDLLNIRLDQVTFDLSQPPYDSLQTYEFEGRDSRAESLSSLESDGEKDDGRVVGGMEELNQKFQRLVEIIREREKEKEGEGGERRVAEGGEAALAALDNTHKQQEEDNEKEQQKWDF
ncbi:uncharacterized protein V6R79_019566 [Siganus canaliculatus]